MAEVWHQALPSQDLKRGQLQKVSLAGTAVLLARLEDGTATASSPACPHAQADLSQGSIYMGAVDCPRHHYLYDLKTGKNRYPREVFPSDLAAQLGDLPLFGVKEEEGWIWVALESSET